jgi:hypothetical protein
MTKQENNTQSELDINHLPRFSNYDTASMLVKASQPRPVKGNMNT